MFLDHATPYFNLSPGRLRAIGRRGGRVSGRRRRLRQAAQPVAVPVIERESTREAIRRLDLAFPHLAGCERTR